MVWYEKGKGMGEEGGYHLITWAQVGDVKVESNDLYNECVLSILIRSWLERWLSG